jgi:hypothetical protein
MIGLSSSMRKWSAATQRQARLVAQSAKDEGMVSPLAAWLQRFLADTAYCLVTWMLFAPVVSVNPAVCVANDPLSEPKVRAM